MAKRRRKMTLFDVMHTGQPIGLQVRTRVPAYQPTPELPVTKKLAKLFGRTPKADPNRPLSAAEELEQLRRELGAKRPAPAAEAEAEPLPIEAAPTFMEGYREPQRQHEPIEEPEPQRAAPTSSFRNSARVAEEFARTAEPDPHLPRAPRRSIREVAGAQWAIAAPKLQAMTGHLRSIGGRGFGHVQSHGSFVRDFASRYAVTAAAAAGVVILLCGSFYAGKLLFSRPAVTLAQSQGTDLAGPEVRSDVMEIAGTSTRSNEAIANLGSPTETKLERNASAAAQVNPAVFGGRRPDVNYVIVQSYRSQAEADATVEILDRHGVKATVELNLPRYAASDQTLYSVVSVEGFGNRITGNTELKAFIAKLSKISEAEAGKTLPRKLDPQPYRLQPKPIQ